MLQTAPARESVALPPRPGPPVIGHRDDVQVLRAVAVVIVVLYHLGVPGFDAGFVGVDVFFVISGYLISRLLLVELMTTGRIALGEFTARRVKRLLPMSFVVMVATLLLIRFRLGPLQELDELPVAKAAATYRANFTLADLGTDYLTTDHVSAFQHYWSLATEEQFYLLLPVTLAVLAYVTKGRSVVRSTALLFGVVGIVTFAIALNVTKSNPPAAYFLLHTRAWEFAAGGLLACAELSGRAPSASRRWRLGGLVMLAVALVVSHRIGFPGPGAAPSVVAASLLIWAGVGPHAVDLSGPAWAAWRWIGDRSYSIYLWHWPPIAVFALDETPFSDRLPMRIVVLVITVVASAVSYRLVEQGLRSAAAFRGVTRSLVVAVLITGLGYLAASTLLSGEVALDGAPAEAVTIDDLRSGPPEPPVELPSNLRPKLTEARRDRPVIYDNGCHGPQTAAPILPTDDCTFGGSGAGGTIVLVGDSFAAQWFDAVDATARDADAQLVNMTKSACSLTGPPDSEFAEACRAWQAAAMERIATIQPDVIVAANAAGRTDRRDGERWAAGVVASIEDIRQQAPDAAIVFVHATPINGDDVTYCLVSNAPSDCSIPADPAFDELQREVIGPAVDATLDVNPLLCDGSECPSVFGDVLVYRDRAHLTRPLVLLLQPEVEATLRTVGIG